MDLRYKANLFLGIISVLLLAGCLNQLDPIVGCWQSPSVFGARAQFQFSSDGSFYLSSPIAGFGGGWERIDTKTIKLSSPNPQSSKNYVDYILWDNQTKTIYMNSTPNPLRYTKAACSQENS
jgi:hypothetical protein